MIELPSPRIETRNTHGTGCTLSSAIAALLPQTADVPEAVREAKRYLTGALAAADELGISRTGCGPRSGASLLPLVAPLKSRWAEVE